MNIAHITNALEWNGTGHTNSTIELAMEQAARGHNVSMISASTDARMRKLMESSGLKVIEGINCTSIAQLIYSSGRLRRHLNRYDVIHLHTVRSTVLTLVANPRIFARRTLATIHNPHQKTSWIMLISRRVVALNKRDAQVVRRSTFGFRRATVINNGMLGGRRLPPIAEVAAAPLHGQAIVFVGALHRRKGLDVLLRAMKGLEQRFPDVHLYVVGNRDNSNMENIAHELGISDRVTFAGFADDPRVYMKAAHIFILPSRNEGFGNVLIEARSCGTPIIASRVGGIPEALSGGQAGLLVEPGNVKSLQELMVCILEDDRLRDDLSRRTQEGLSQFTVKRAADDYEEIYADLLPPDPSPALKSYSPRRSN